MSEIFNHDDKQKRHINPELTYMINKPDESFIKLINDMQREINLINDRVVALERMAALKMFPRKICGYCSGTGKVFLGTICDPPIGDCGICKGKGFI